MLNCKGYQNNSNTNLTKSIVQLYWEDEKGEAK